VQLTHTFTVPAPVEQTWEALGDIESVAGCFPGATVTSVEGECAV
jgi:carbon monoxide dehydrogenase subunit G